MGHVVGFVIMCSSLPLCKGAGVELTQQSRAQGMLLCLKNHACSACQAHPQLWKMCVREL